MLSNTLIRLVRMLSTILLGFACACLVSFSRAAADEDFKPDSMCPVTEADFSEFFLSQVILNGYSNSTYCSNPVRGQCSFYEDCLETRYHCGPDDYPLGYGKKYCDKFNAAKGRLSNQGQTWMLDTMECLQLTLVPDAIGSQEVEEHGGSACDVLRRKAFDSHARCYIESGVCALGLKDWTKIVEIIDLKTLFGSWEALKEALEAATGCLKMYSFVLDAFLE
jgi:hypothetical protein